MAYEHTVWRFVKNEFSNPYLKQDLVRDIFLTYLAREHAPTFPVSYREIM